MDRIRLTTLAFLLTAAQASAELFPAPFTLESAFLLAHGAARRAADPRAVLSSGRSALEDKLSAIDSIQSRLITQDLPGRRAGIDALVKAATDPRQPPEVRAKALTHLGYCVPPVADDSARVKAVETLLSALQSPTYRIYALRGLGPAAHKLPKTHEGIYLAALLDLLDTAVAGEERATAAMALYAFVSSHSDLPKRKPALMAELDARLLVPIEASPEAFVRDPRGSEASRQMILAVLRASARHRRRHGDLFAMLRTLVLFEDLAKVETSPTVRAWLDLYRGTNPQRPSGEDGSEDDVAGPETP